MRADSSVKIEKFPNANREVVPETVLEINHQAQDPNTNSVHLTKDITGLPDVPAVCPL